MSADPDIIFNALQQLDVCDVLPNDQNPRLLFPQEELDRLAESIDQTGILVPIVVYPKDGKYILVDGERRFRCAQTLGHSKVPAVITGEKTGLELLEQMFNIHLIREPWQDMPTARALQQLVEHLKRRNGTDPTDAELELETGLSLERVRRFRYVITLPDEWQQYIQTGTIPLNFFWELKRYVIDPLAKIRPQLFAELDGGRGRVMSAFVEKRLNGIITDTVSLRNVTPIIRFSAQAEHEGGATTENLDKSIRELVENSNTTIDEVFEDTVQTMVEVDKLERRSGSMVAAYSRLMFTSATDDDRTRVREIGERLISQLERIIRDTIPSGGQVN